MKRVGIFYGSDSGSTAEIAFKIANELSRKGFRTEIIDISEAHGDIFDRFDHIILGSSTMGMGVLQEDWEFMLGQLAEADFSGKKVALFGTGDQVTYPDTFVDGLGVLFEKVSGSGAHVVGRWSTDGYKFRESQGVMDREFVGLAIDEDTQPLHSNARIRAWVDQLAASF